MTPVQGRNFSNLLSGMVRFLSVMPGPAALDQRTVARPMARRHDPGVPSDPGTVPGSADADTASTPH